MNSKLARCPVCDGALHVAELACKDCGTTIRQVFDRCRYCSVSAEHLQFLEVFLRSRGNLSGVGADLGISYPTVARRLDGLLAALGLQPLDSQPAPAPVAPSSGVTGRDDARRAILEMLDRGDLTAEEATRRLREL